jgi:hypothetical protein
MLNVMLPPSPLEGRWLGGTVAGHGEIDAYVNSMSVCKNPINTNMPTVDMIHFQSSYCSYKRGTICKTTRQTN